jgi:hypothetical protein
VTIAFTIVANQDYLGGGTFNNASFGNGGYISGYGVTAYPGTNTGGSGGSLTLIGNCTPGGFYMGSTGNTFVAALGSGVGYDVAIYNNIDTSAYVNDVWPDENQYFEIVSGGSAPVITTALGVVVHLTLVPDSAFVTTWDSSGTDAGRPFGFRLAQATWPTAPAVSGVAEVAVVISDFIGDAGTLRLGFRDTATGAWTTVNYGGSYAGPGYYGKNWSIGVTQGYVDQYPDMQTWGSMNDNYFVLVLHRRDDLGLFDVLTFDLTTHAIVASERNFAAVPTTYVNAFGSFAFDTAINIDTTAHVTTEHYFLNVGHTAVWPPSTNTSRTPVSVYWESISKCTEYNL